MIDRQLLDLISRQAVGGVALAAQLGITRSAVWKRMEQLREAGFEIETRAGQGYFLKRPVEWLDEGLIRRNLNADAKKRLGRFCIAEQIDSTNSWAKTHAGHAQGTDVFLAERQTAGRGRLGRQWASPMAANLYLSLRRSFNKGLSALSGLSLVVGVMLAKSLREQGFSDIGLKWPNDVYASTGKKCGGILIELAGEANAEISAVIGIGLNVRMPEHSAKNIDQAWVDLQGLSNGKAISRNAILIALLNEILPGLQAFEEQGADEFLAQWDEYDIFRGRQVRLLDGAQVQTGQVLGITAQGALRLQLDGVERHYHSGEISLRPL